MKEKRSIAQRKMEALLNKSQKEQRSLNEDESKEYDALKAEVRSWNDKIEALENWLAEQKAPKKEGRKYSLAAAIRAKMAGKELEGIEAEADRRGRQGMEPTGDNSFFIPMEKRSVLPGRYRQPRQGGRGH